jgi:undecaprenyl diphosphate synthase
MSATVAGLKIPSHIAIIMDGNGRWARQQGLRRILGHESGAKTVRDISRECSRLGVGRLTLFAFSAENWKRPEIEVKFLMKLLGDYLVNERPEIMDNNIRFTAIGRLEELPGEVKEKLAETIRISSKNTGMVLSLALAYGGRNEIVDAVRRLAREVKEGKRTPESIDEETISKYLYDSGAPDPDLLIRTGGDLRVSNFLLWQISYTELWVTPVKWPDFSKDHLHEAIREFSQRDRRFGNVNTDEA